MSYILKKILTKVWKKVELKDQENLKTLILPKNIKQVDFNLTDNKYQSFSIFTKDDFSIKQPVIIDVHGGGWNYGSKELNKPFCMVLASYNYKVIDISYRLANEVNLANMIKDIYLSINKAYELKEQFNLDFTKVMLIGDSAGSHLISIIYLLQENEELRKNLNLDVLPFKVTCMCLNHPVCYLKSGQLIKDHKIIDFLAKHEIIGELYGFYRYKNTLLYKYTSNFDKLLEQLDYFPPTLIITSIGDLAYKDLAIKTFNDLKKENVEVELYISEKKPNQHVFNISKINDNSSKLANAKIIDFFKKHYK